MGGPNLPDPDRIDPHAPPETPAAAPLPETPPSSLPELPEAAPGRELPGPGPGEWQPLDFLLMPYRAWSNIFACGPSSRRGNRRARPDHDLIVPEALEESGEAALFA